jgi:3-methyladenine DNA glycosylase AlkD
MEIHKELLINKDDAYKIFQEKLNPECKNIIGVRMPLLRKMAKTLAKEDISKFIYEYNAIYYEENMLKILVLEYDKKTNFNDILKLIDYLLKYVDSWSLCDALAIALKIFKNHREEGLNYIKKLINSKEEYHKRLGLVLLLLYYKDEKYKTEVFTIFNNITLYGYYEKMALSWAIAEFYSVFKEETIDFLKNAALDNFTYNKALQKIVESNKILDEDKRPLKKRVRME